MCWGFPNDGWEPLIRECAAKIEAEIERLEKDNPEEFKKAWEKGYYRAAQVKEKFGCYDGQTQVLTKNGWKYFADLSYNDELAALKDGKHLSYEKPTDIISYRYNGQMYRLSTRGVDLLVTPNHNLYAAKGTYYNGKYEPPKRVDYDFEFVQPEKYFGKNKRFLKSATWKGERQELFVLPSRTQIEHVIPEKKEKYFRTYTDSELSINMDVWLDFLGWYVAEGCIGKNETDISIAYNYKSQLEIQKIIDSVRNIGFEPVLEKSIKIYSKQLGDWLLENCGHLAPNKRVSKFIFDLPPAQIEIFLKSLFAGDGHRSLTAHTLSTTSKGLAEDVEVLLLLAGYTFRSRARPARTPDKKINERKIVGKHPCYEVVWLKNSSDHNTTNKGMSKKSVERWETYTGTVYCATVPGNLLFIKREGRGVWCGNSLRFYMTSANEVMMHAIEEAEAKSAITCEDCGQPGTTGGTGWIKTRCEECRKRPKPI
jgi:replicative DNA helicase Mcm